MLLLCGCSKQGLRKSTNVCPFIAETYCAGALDGKELFTIEGSENWRSTPDNWRSAKNAHPFIAAKPTLTHLVANWKSTNSGDELNLSHLPRDPDDDLHNRDIVHLVRALQLQDRHSFLLCKTPGTCHCTTTGVTNLVQKLQLWGLAGMSTDSSDELNRRHFRRVTQRRCMITGTSTAAGTALAAPPSRKLNRLHEFHDLWLCCWHTTGWHPGGGQEMPSP